MIYKVEDITAIIDGQLLNAKAYDSDISNIIYDTRKMSFQEKSIFIALAGKTDGHQYLPIAYKKGIRNFLVSRQLDLNAYPEANFIYCKNTLVALQKWATHHRSKMQSPVIAITGSNGKTIVKEWLAQALEKKYHLGKSPLSYNSQLGVALSLLQMDSDIDLAIIEAGISEKNEMTTLRQMIQPKIGIITNIGDAHSQGFSSIEEKLEEKLSLFDQAQLIIYNKDMTLLDSVMSAKHKLKSVSWGKKIGSDLHIISYKDLQTSKQVIIQHGIEVFNLKIPFSSSHEYENCMQVISYLILDNWTNEEIQSVIAELSALPNRLEIKPGINDCLVIDDSYSSDLASMQLALEQLDLVSDKKHKMLILTPFEQQKAPHSLYAQMKTLLLEKKISNVVGIGFSPQASQLLALDVNYNTTQDCIDQLDTSLIHDTAILIKGARKYKLDKISSLLSEQVHQTQLETNLSAVVHNLNYYKTQLIPTTKIMAVVKAEAYGSGSTQMAKFLEQQKVDYLAVALIDEAVQLRKNNCKLPLMIFNIQEDNLNKLWEYELEPEVYNYSLLEKLAKVAFHRAQRLKIHLKIDTGMNRLGFLAHEIPELIAKLNKQPYLQVCSIFSHLASSEQKSDDTFTLQQLSTFNQLYEQLSHGLGLKPLKHILNTAGIIRFPAHQYDMVRLGLGLYGIDESKTVQAELEKAHTLKAKVLQIKALSPHMSTGYNRSGTNPEPTEIAIISIGYADGILRAAGNGRHHFSINGQLFPTIGNICMDVTMLDLGLESKVQVGDEVLLFGPNNAIEALANCCSTITYEILSRIAPRVKRTYIYA